MTQGELRKLYNKRVSVTAPGTPTIHGQTKHLLLDGKGGIFIVLEDVTDDNHNKYKRRIIMTCAKDTLITQTDAPEQMT